MQERAGEAWQPSLATLEEEAEGLRVAAQTPTAHPTAALEEEAEGLREAAQVPTAHSVPTTHSIAAALEGKRGEDEKGGSTAPSVRLVTVEAD